MIKKLVALAAVAMLMIGMGCANSSSPIIPEKNSQTSPEQFFNQFDLSNPVVAAYTYKDDQGNVLASGKLGRNDNGLYVIESRGAQFDLDLTPLHLLDVVVTYNNPAGTIMTGPNAGLPYYYIGQTVDYNIDILSMMNGNIGGYNPPFGYAGPAQLTAMMCYADFGVGGEIIVGGPLPGAPEYDWEGIISPGYQTLNDTFAIVPGTLPGLDVTTCEIEAPIMFGLIDIIFFDGIAGIWDPQ
jgi:hypothetical protein